MLLIKILRLYNFTNLHNLSFLTILIVSLFKMNYPKSTNFSNSCLHLVILMLIIRMILLLNFLHINNSRSVNLSFLFNLYSQIMTTFSKTLVYSHLKLKLRCKPVNSIIFLTLKVKIKYKEMSRIFKNKWSNRSKRLRLIQLAIFGTLSEMIINRVFLIHINLITSFSY